MSNYCTQERGLIDYLAATLAVLEEEVVTAAWGEVQDPLAPAPVAIPMVK